MFFFRGKDFSFELNSRTYIMGILNTTKDSFYDGGKWNSPETAIAHALEMGKCGADIIDIGAQSTRPGHIALSADEELKIIMPYIDRLVSLLTVPVSVDTFYPEVAEYCISRGAAIINDVSGVFNPKMAEIVKKYNCGWIVMHTGGGDADNIPVYSNGVVNSVLEFFDEIRRKCDETGISSANICYDMGIGFGKTDNDNVELIRNISRLKIPERAVLTALSNKRVVANALGCEKNERIFGTIAADTAAIAGGTDFIRVHEVRESKLAAIMADKIYRR